MRKIKLLLPLSLMLFFTSCKKQSDDLLYINRAESLFGTVKLESKKQVEDILFYEDMIILLTQENCTACHNIYPIIDQVIKDNQFFIYQVDVSIYRQLDKSISYMDKISYTPAMIFFKDQKPVHIQEGLPDKYDSLLNLILSRCKLTNYFSLNTFKQHFKEYSGKTHTYHTLDTDEKVDASSFDYSYLKEKTSSNITVLYTWRRCKDCKELKETVLNSYTENKIYYYEVDGMYQMKRDEDENIKEEGLKIWKDFNTEFSLSYLIEENNNSAIVPTFVSYPSKENAVFKSFYSYKVNEDLSLSFKNSFYQEVKDLKTERKVNRDYLENEQDRSLKEALDELNSTVNHKATTIEKEKVLSFLNRNN